MQQYVHLFGGDPTKVTIAGESAGEPLFSTLLLKKLIVNPSGGGSVMLLAMAYGGTIGTTLFQNVSAQC